MSACLPQSDDFAPLPRAERLVALPPPLPGPWERVLQRLRRDPRAWLAGSMLLLLLAMAGLGPLVWHVDPAAQVLDEISLPPAPARTALLLAEPASAATGATQATHCTQPPCVEGLASTGSVQLLWPAVAGATAYAIHRHELAPAGAHDLGLPLARTNSTRYRDRLGLEERAYYYTISALDAAGTATSNATRRVEVVQALTPAQARARGLDASNTAPGGRLQLPAHPLGTDYLGRDLLARSLHGARTSLFIGIAAPLVFVLFGTLYGALAGLAGGRLDDAMMRVADFVVALPFLLFMILFKVAFGIGPGESGVMPMLLALVLLGWPTAARLVRAEVMRLREEPFVLAARLLGASPLYLFARHLLPNIGGTVLVTLSFAIPSAIFTEAFLSFIGLGVAPPVPSWGSMCNDGIRSLLSAPHEMLVPAGFISLTVLAFNFLGDALRDALDVRAEAAR